MSHNLEHGLMSQVQSLINPVNYNMDNAGSKLDKQYYQKKHYRGHNRDCCDACNENGADLLCCDSCPAAFHFNCVDPPMSEEDGPVKWSCKRCTYLKGSGLYEVNYWQRISRKINLPESKVGTPSPQNLISLFFAEAVQHVAEINPTEFKLPMDYGCIEPALPGTSRQVFKKSCPSRAKQVITELENFVVPKPISVCFNCNRTSRIGALIKCDICPKFYHLDCLNPPLTIPPSTIWSCPLHPEPFLESKLLESTLISERVRLWDYTNEALDGNTVKRDFIRKARKRCPMFTRKVSCQKWSSSQIPQSITHCYEYEKSTCDDVYTREPSCLEQETTSATSVILDMDWMSNVTSAERELEALPFKGNSLLYLADIASNMKLIDIKQVFDSSRLLNQLDMNTIKSLAAQKLDELYLDKVSISNTGDIEEKENDSGVSFNYFSKAKKNDVLLVLYCVTTTRNYEITKPCLEVGLGSQAGLNLVHSGCKNISKKHATIYYDKVTMQWELINYSVYGTMVNNCLFGCNVGGLQTRNNRNVEDDKAQEYFHEIVQKRKKTLLEQVDKTEFNSHTIYTANNSTNENCKCSRSGVWISSTWEGAARLEPGVHIQIGCLKFIVRQPSAIQP